MREDVKKSLDTVFEHAQLNEKRQASKKKRPNWLPAVALVGVLAIAIILISNSFAPEQQMTTAPVEQTNIFKLKGTYIGSGADIANIVAYALPKGAYDGIQLQTTEEPYGIMVPLKEEIEEDDELKVVMYVFTLVRNAEYVEFQYKKESTIWKKETMSSFYALDFSKVQSEFELEKQLNHLKGIRWTKPQLQFIGQEGLLEQALTTAHIVDEEVRMDRLDYIVQFEEKEYLLFVQDTAVHFVAIDRPADVFNFEPEPVYKVADSVAGLLIDDFSSDFVAISGEVTFIGGNMIQVEESEHAGNMGSETLLHVLVDRPSDFKVGDIVQVWTKEVTNQYPPQAIATKVKYYTTVQAMEVSVADLLLQNGIPLLETEGSKDRVFGATLNGVKPNVYEIKGKQLFLFEFNNEAERKQGKIEFNKNTELMNVTSFQVYEKGSVLLFYVHGQDLADEKIPYDEEIKAVLDLIE